MDRETEAVVTSTQPASGRHTARWSAPEYVVLALLTLVAWTWTQSTVAPSPCPPRLEAISLLSWLSRIVREYWLDERTLPRTLERLTVPSGPEGWRYLETLPLDPWRHPFSYTILDERSAKFELRSAGEDGRLSTEDDVVSVQRAQPSRPR